MILVSVVAGVGENDIGSKASRNLLERVFDNVEGARKVAVTELVQMHGVLCCVTEEFARSTLCLLGACTDCAPNHPLELRSRSHPRELKDRSTTTNLDIVGVRAETENAERGRPSREVQANHDGWNARDWGDRSRAPGAGS